LFRVLLVLLRNPEQSLMWHEISALTGDEYDRRTAVSFALGLLIEEGVVTKNAGGYQIDRGAVERMLGSAFEAILRG
jgi:hypothetical protein